MVPSSRAMFCGLFWLPSGGTSTTDHPGNTPSLPRLGFDAGDASAGCVARLSTIDNSQLLQCVGRMSSRCVGGMHRAFVDDSPSSRCVGGPSRAAPPSSCIARLCWQERGSVVAMRRRDASRVRRQFALFAMRRRSIVAMRRRSFACCVVATGASEAGGGGFGSSSSSLLLSDGWGKPKREGRTTG
jgi:hypothetical protein